MKPPIRLAVLETDTPLPPVKEKYGSYGEIFEILLASGAKSMNRPDLVPGDGLDVSKWEVVDKMEYPKLEEVDALLITGSKHNAFDDTPWIVKLVDYAKEALASKRVRIIGVCFGHQILGRALGAKVGRNEIAWEIAVNDVELSKKGKELFGKDKIGHPEFKQDIMQEIIQARHSQGIFDDLQYQEGVHKMALPHDGVLVAAGFLKFLLEE
ncbi:putative gmp synthase [Phaeomoniella chlamydospora]|uniref:Putative gmp synthase n=1 Tax=Phaeomoniella chlamydospora TaxID=158046 RepID=A0A0G2HH18_PHACM|nr:putative gmp synthase [Phaeomoniella chlamydospora]